VLWPKVTVVDTVLPCVEFETHGQSALATGAIDGKTALGSEKRSNFLEMNNQAAQT
jgi:hypothetical protein